ncbi:MAG: RNA methyltransferase [Bacteroidetes bacterium]|nr:MAG: RNA methyltransferase [Bacteroidota bacterium]
MLSKPAIQLIRSLQKKKFRMQHGLFMVEGEKMVKELIRANRSYWSVHRLLASAEWAERNKEACRAAGLKAEIIETGEMRKISALVSPPGVLALVGIPEYAMEAATLKNEALLAFSEISDPGNLGTIIRTADWFGIRHLVCTPGSTDAWSPKVVQASMGAIFRVKLYYMELDQILKQCEKDGRAVYGTYLQGENLFETPLERAPLILFGSESHGLDQALSNRLNGRITIPSYAGMEGGSESLNIASAVAIVSAELARQTKAPIRSES